jgi:hypothetical protein
VVTLSLLLLLLLLLVVLMMMMMLMLMMLLLLLVVLMLVMGPPTYESERQVAHLLTPCADMLLLLSTRRARAGPAPQLTDRIQCRVPPACLYLLPMPTGRSGEAASL